MRITLQPVDELQGILDETSTPFARALLDYAKGVIDGTAVGNSDLDVLISEHMAWADLMARRRVHLYVANVTRTANYAAFLGFQMPRVPFLKAIESFFARVPAVARKAADVARVYARRGFTLARAVEVETVKKVQEVIGRSLKDGVSAAKSTDVIAQLGDWSRSYADTVYRMNVAGAYTAGTMQEAADPVVRQVVPAIAYTAVRDANARPNHLAADGLIAAENDPIWEPVAPPCGYRCRCGLRFVTMQEATLRGVVLPDGRIRPATMPPGFYRDPGFVGGRPDGVIYGR